MNALYISNYRKNADRKHRKFNVIRKWRNDWFGRNISGQDGVFAASLYTVFELEESNLSWLARNVAYVNRTFDALFVNQKSGANRSGLGSEDGEFISRVKVPKVLVATNAQASILPADEIMDLFDLVFKREHYLDLDRYDRSERNKQKVRSTMLGCPLLQVTTRNVKEFRVGKRGFSDPEEHHSHDLFSTTCFFFGKTTAPIRLSSMTRLRDEGVAVLGGLNPNKRYAMPIPPELIAPRFSRKNYIEAIRKSRVGLALEGYGEFTFRHHEILFLCSFLLCSSVIRGLKLPIELVENEHYVCFEDSDDLADKVKFYLKRDDLRNAIAKKGRDLFVREYDFKKHGDSIRRAVGGA